jgi:hypothetical protein
MGTGPIFDAKWTRLGDANWASALDRMLEWVHEMPLNLTPAPPEYCTANEMKLFNIAHRRMTITGAHPSAFRTWEREMPINVCLVDQLKRVPVMRSKQFVMLTALLVGATSTTATAQQGVGGALSAPIGGPPAPAATPGATSGVNPNTGFGSSSAGGSAGTSTGPTNPNSSGAISGIGKTNPRQ